MSSSPEQLMPRLEQAARELGVPLDASRLRLLSVFADQLLVWNRRVNLTAITDPAEIEIRHFVDSLTLAPLIRARVGDRPARLVDVGTGAGLPGIPLALALPGLDVTLVEATARKAAFVSHAIQVLGLTNAHPAVGRAEEVGRAAEHRGSYDFAVARAVGSVAALVELLVPLVRVGGWALLMKKASTADDEVRQAAPALRQLAATVEAIVEAAPPGLLEDHAIVVVRKDGATDDRYPRRPGVPQRRPLEDL